MPRTRARRDEYHTYFTRVRIRNLKCYKDSGDIHLKPLTIILGPNNSGKSTVLNSFQLFSQTAASPNVSTTLVTSGQFIDLGSYYDLLHLGEKNPDQRIRLEFEIQFSKGSPFSLWTSESSKADKNGRAVLSVAYWFDKKRGIPRLDSATLSRDGQVKSSYGRVHGKLVPLNIPPRLRRYVVVQAQHFVPTFHTYRQVPKKAAARLGHASSRAFSHSYAWNQVFSGIRYVAPLRSAVPRFGIVGRTTGGHPGEGGEELLRMLKDERKVVGSNKNILDLMREWVCARLGLLRRLDLVPLDRDRTVLKLVGDDPGGFEQINLASMGEGFSQMLPILANVLGADYDDCVLVEQPEIHLHPRLQAELGDLFIEQLAKGNAHQFLVETHSEHLLLRVRRRVAEGAIRASDVAVLVVERVDGQPRIRELELKDDGRFTNWPIGFFEEGYQEAFGLAMASRKRRD